MDNGTESANMTSPIAVVPRIGTYIVLPLSVVGLVENGVIFFLLCSRPLLRQRPHVIFTLSLSFSDFLCSFIVILICSARFNPAIYTKEFCLFTRTASLISFGTSLLQALLISIERVLAISASSVYIRTFKGNKKYVSILTAWLILSSYSIFLVIAFPVTGSYTGCVPTLMYDKQSYFGISIGTQVLFIPLVLATLVLYAVAAFRLYKRMKQVSFSNNGIKSRRPTAITNVNQVGTLATEAEAKINNDMCSKTNTSSGMNDSDRSNMQQIALAEPKVAATSTVSNDGKGFNLETKILKKETCSIPKLKCALKTVTLVQLCLFVSFVPLSFVRILILINVKEARVAESIISILPIMHPVINPILYVWLIKEFRMVLLCRK